MARRHWPLSLLLLASACSASDTADSSVATLASEPTVTTSADVVVAVAFDVIDGGVTVAATLHNNSGATFELPYMWEFQRSEGDGWSTVGYLPWVGLTATTPPEMCLDQHTCEVAPSVKMVDAGETVQLVARVTALPNGIYRVVAPELAEFSQSDVPTEFTT